MEGAKHVVFISICKYMLPYSIANYMTNSQCWLSKLLALIQVQGIPRLPA